MASRRLLLVIGIPVALAAVVSGGTWAYINLVKEDAPERLALTPSNDEGGAGPSAGGPSGSVEGRWKVAAGSRAGYRAKEVLFGQSTTGAGRTDKVTGEFVVQGSSVASGSFTVDMASITSDESKRDNQFRTRIMAVSQFPTSTFKLTQPIELGAAASGGGPVSTSATGDLTIRGRTRPATIKLDAKMSGGKIEVAGTHPIVWSEWGIPNPSFGPAQVEDRGELEFLLVFEKA